MFKNSNHVLSQKNQLDLKVKISFIILSLKNRATKSRQTISCFMLQSITQQKTHQMTTAQREREYALLHYTVDY